MKRHAHLTLVDADKYSALVSRCTEQRERAERAEARIAVLERYTLSCPRCGGDSTPTWLCHGRCSMRWASDAAALARTAQMEKDAGCIQGDDDEPQTT